MIAKYNEYYERAKKECWLDTTNSEDRNGEKWWDSNTIDDKVNNMPILENKTDVNSSEWVILHRMLINLFLSYVNEYPLDNETYSFSLDLDLINGDWRSYINNVGSIKIEIPDSDMDYSYNSYHLIDNQDVIDSYDELDQQIYYFIVDFIRKHRTNINITLTKMFLRLDNLTESLKEGKWMPSLDSSMSFYNGNSLVVCSM